MIRPRPRTLAILVVLFVVLPVMEIFLLVQLAQLVGLLPVLALVIVEALVGSWLIRRRWRAAWQSLQPASDGTPPSAGQPGATDTAVFVLGGIALIFPGLITDLVALVCLIPYTRRLPRRLLDRALERRIAGLTGLTGLSGMPGMPGMSGMGPFGPFGRPGSRFGGSGSGGGFDGSGDVIEGEVVDEPAAGESRRPDEPIVIRGEIDDPRP